jgi:hypothetical protein
VEPEDYDNWIKDGNRSGHCARYGIISGLYVSGIFLPSRQEIKICYSNLPIVIYLDVWGSEDQCHPSLQCLLYIDLEKLKGK